MPLQRASQIWYSAMQSDWQVNACALVGLATIIKTIPRTLSMAKRIPALLYIENVFIVVPF